MTEPSSKDVERFQNLISMINSYRSTRPEIARAIELDLCKAGLAEFNAVPASADAVERCRVQCTKTALRGIIAGRFKEGETPILSGEFDRLLPWGQSVL